MASIYKRNGKWRAEVRKGGVCTSKTFLLRQNAEKWARSAEIAIESGERPEAYFTLSEALDKYLRDVTPHKKGARWERVRISRFKQDPICNKRLKDIGPADFAEWRDKRLKQVSPASVKRELNIWSGVFTVARREWGWIDHNPISNIRKPGKTQHRYRTMSDKELELLLAYFDKTEIAAIIGIAIETGMRQSEITELQPEDIRGNYLVLEDTKNGTKREVPLSPKAMELVKQVPFTVSAASVSTRFRQAVKDLKIDNLKFHDTRHTAATRLAKVFSLLELCRIFGWKDPRNAMIYFNPSASDLAAKL